LNKGWAQSNKRVTVAKLEERVKQHERERDGARERERVRGREAELEKRESMRERNRKEYVDVRNLKTSPLFA
jgi:hypothetical protein